MKKRSIIVYAFMVVMAAFIVNLFTATSQVEASENIEREKVVISVEIEEGDTLWSIASEYYTDEYKDMNEFIDAIKKCNAISDEVKIGQKILVPYYRVVL